MEARRHEKPRELNPDEFPNRDVQVTEQFLKEHEPLLVFLGARLLEACSPARRRGLIPRRAESQIRTYCTLESGLYYETRATNLIAAGVHDRVQQSVEGLRKELAGKNAMPLRDVESWARWCSWKQSSTKITDARAAVHLSIICAPIPRRRTKPRACVSADPGMTGFIVFAHGSRIESANQAVREVAAQMAASGRHVVEAAFLELGAAGLAGATGLLIARGASASSSFPIS